MVHGKWGPWCVCIGQLSSFDLGKKPTQTQYTIMVSCWTEKRFGQVCDASARNEGTQRKMEFTRLQVSILIGHGGLDIIKANLCIFYLMSTC
jgi:hypothetical protein